MKQLEEYGPLRNKSNLDIYLLGVYIDKLVGGREMSTVSRCFLRIPSPINNMLSLDYLVKQQPYSDFTNMASANVFSFKKPNNNPQKRTHIQSSKSWWLPKSF